MSTKFIKPFAKKNISVFDRNVQNHTNKNLNFVLLLFFNKNHEKAFSTDSIFLQQQQKCANINKPCDIL